MSQATAILDAIARKHPKCALVREVVVNDEAAYPTFKEQLDTWVPDGDTPPPDRPVYWRRIDALMFDGGQTRTAIEVKISRGDYRRDTVAKRRAWQAITDRFVYATPVGLVSPDEVPAGCGLWEVDEHGTVTVVKRAKRNTEVQPVPHQVLVALAYRLAQR